MKIALLAAAAAFVVGYSRGYLRGEKDEHLVGELREAGRIQRAEDDRHQATLRKASAQRRPRHGWTAV